MAMAEDMAVLLLVLEACTNDMNADGSMPTARIKENGQNLFANSYVQRPWCPRRYRALRDHLSELGHIDWKDRRSVPAALSPTGEGQAAKWRLSEAMMETLAEEKLKPGTAVVAGEEETKAEGGERGDCLLQNRAGEEDLYRDNSYLISGAIPLPDWFTDFRQPRLLRPVLDVGFREWKMAA